MPKNFSLDQMVRHDFVNSKIYELLCVLDPTGSLEESEFVPEYVDNVRDAISETILGMLNNEASPKQKEEFEQEFYPYV